MTGRNLVLSGGPQHDFAATTAALVALAAEEGIESVVPDGPDDALDLLASDPGRFDLVTVNALWWQMPAARHDHLRNAWGYRLSDRHAHALHRHVADGGGLLALHTAVICFDGHPCWTDLLGATWDPDRSWHPPLGSAVVRATERGRLHPLTAGVPDFALTDEVYVDLDRSASGSEGPDPLLVSAVDGVDQPVLWCRTVGKGRVVVDLLGHDAAAIGHPAHAEVLRRSLRWSTGAAS